MSGFVGSLAAQEKYEGIVFMENEPWETVLEKAKTVGRLIFMDCYTTWCWPCKGLTDNVFPLKEVGDFFNANFVNVKYDMEKGDGLMLHKKFKEHIPGFPSLLLINSDGKVVHKMAGYHEGGELIAGMKAGMEGNTLFAMEAEYHAGARDLETVSAYVAALKGAFDTAKQNEVIDAYIAALEDYSELEKPEVWALAGGNIKDPYSPVFAWVVANIEGRLPYRANMDRYKLESQLANAISSHITDIVDVTRNSKNADSLRMAREKAEVLRPMLATNAVKRFPDYLAKLRMNDLILAAQPMELFNQLAIIRQTGLLKQESSFLADCYGYIIDNVKDKKVVGAALDEVVALQGPKMEKPSPLASNYYDIIARGYAKLREKDKAAEAQATYDELDAAHKAWFDDFRRKIMGEAEE